MPVQAPPPPSWGAPPAACCCGRGPHTPLCHLQQQRRPENSVPTLLHLVAAPPAPPAPPVAVVPEESAEQAVARCIHEMALLLRPATQGGCWLSRPLQRKLVSLVHCPLSESEGRARAARAARSLGERCALELLLQHHQHQAGGGAGGGQQLSAALWAAVRARGCQFLGPHMQEEVLRLVLLALEDGSPLSRKVLVLFVVQRLAPHFPQASKTSIGHVVQLLYRASCFKVSKREGDSSLMQLKEEFCTYEALRREHDAQIVQIASEAGLRIAPEQWSSLLYGDAAHRSHMQSLVDKLQSPQSFSQSVHELSLALQRTGDPARLAALRPHFDLLAHWEPDGAAPTWEELSRCVLAARACLQGLVAFLGAFGGRRANGGAPSSPGRGGRPDGGSPSHAPGGGPRYKTSLCRDVAQRGSCPRGAHCTFAHSQEEMDRYRARRPPRTSTDPKPVVSSDARTSANRSREAGSSPEHQCGPPVVVVSRRNSPPPALAPPTLHLGTEPLPPVGLNPESPAFQPEEPWRNPSPPCTCREDDDDWGSSHGSCDSSTSSHHPTRPCPSEEDPLVPFDPPLVSKYGPISRCARTLVRGPAPIQVTSRRPEELTSPTAALRLPLASAAAAPSFYAQGFTLLPAGDLACSTDPRLFPLKGTPSFAPAPGALLAAPPALVAPPTKGSESWAGQPQVPTSVGPWLLNQLEEPSVCADACWPH